MAKTTTTLAGEEQAAPELTSERLTFRDKVYTSRTLIIPETDRTLPAVSYTHLTLPTIYSV